MSEDELKASSLENSGNVTSPPPIFDLEASGSCEKDALESPSEGTTSTLIGTSEDRKKLFDELEKQVKESERIDREKAERRDMEREETRKKAEDAIRLAREEGKELENLRRRRELRVPCEPREDEECAVLCVRHPVLGKVNRRFKTNSTMSEVYDWVGSLNLTPKYFSLSVLPGKPIYPDETIARFSGMTLSMIEQDEPLPLSSCDYEVSFYDGTDEPELLDDTIVESGLSEEGYCGLLPLSDKPPDILLSGEEACATATTAESYQELDAKREAERTKLKETYISFSRNEIVGELLKLYKDDDILIKKILPSFEEENASGDGVLREVYSLFWQNFVSDNCFGSSQFAVRIVPQMSDKYVALGRIITHQFLQCGTFPVQLARASVHHMLFGKVSEECLLDSFLQLLPPKQRDIFAGALQGQRPFPLDEVIDVLDDHNVQTLPSPENLRGIVLQIATTEFVEKPFLALLKIREGMGRFWDEVSPQSIDAIYQLCVATPSTVIDHLHCVPLDAQEAKVFRWLKRYVSEADPGMLTRLVQFCTASQTLLPDQNISVKMENMQEMAMRPKARTCFQILHLPRNYFSFHQLKENLDFYLSPCTSWEFED